ncbi:hypothetical protein [Acidipropionibacterium virtanenii]|uniref:Uncharacterized protein n=1 Tax=Acidipropionibacterium virtanenii TaxID=2057246 RepID=A0A344UQ36_9ACTN|nr:hypothetical protein [Acidipropionibacterium virtanenii]AXE37384.1 hypothetical protein JS278_00187 [Acidipropionibacterium virtanenii]
MLWNIVRADCYRLLHSRFLLLTAAGFVLTMAAFALMAQGESGSGFSFGGQTGVGPGGTPLIDGFVGFGFGDRPGFWELMYTATCFGAVSVLAVIVTTVAVAGGDDRNGITRVAVAGGQSPIVLYLSRLLVVTGLSALLWTLHNVITLLVTLAAGDASLTGRQVGRWAGLVGLEFVILVALILATGLVYLVTRNSMAAVVIMMVLFIATIIVNAMAGPDPNVLVGWLLAADPVWHMNRITRYWAEPWVLHQMWWFAGIFIPVALVLSWLALAGREVR